MGYNKDAFKSEGKGLEVNIVYIEKTLGTNVRKGDRKNGSSTLILNYILKYPVYQDIFLSRNFDFIVAIVAYYLKLCYNM